MIMIPTEEKNLIDIASVTALFGVFSDMLPVFVLFLTGIWTLIRIYETDTVQKLVNKSKTE